MSDTGTDVTLWDALAEIPDHRDPSGRRFELRSVLAISIGAVLAGRDSLAAVARWGRKLTEKALVALDVDREKAPCHATYHNVFKDLDVVALERAVGKWAQGQAQDETLGHVALDGKELRGSQFDEYPGVRLLAAYCEKVKGVVSQERVPSETNEITTALKVLKEIPLKGTVVTGDAIFTQKKICKKVINGGGDYFFTVKDNQEGLRCDIEAAFAEPFSPLPATVS